MKEVILTLPDKAYEQLAIDAAAAHKSPEQWILDKLFAEPESQPCRQRPILCWLPL